MISERKDMCGKSTTLRKAKKVTCREDICKLIKRSAWLSDKRISKRKGNSSPKD